ncbi:MAG: pilus assembly protein PilP [Epsilonproteobacteria bacterium]|nr:pilus assembly protein PilP [Campylobacterota bacterium]
MKNNYITLVFIISLIFLPNPAMAVKIIVAGSNAQVERFRYSGRDPFINLEKLKQLNAQKGTVEENANKSEIVARIRAISLVGIITGKLGKRALIVSNGNVYIVKIDDHIGRQATVVGIKNSLISIKGTYRDGNVEKSVVVKLELPR